LFPLASLRLSRCSTGARSFALEAGRNRASTFRLPALNSLAELTRHEDHHAMMAHDVK
jgi:hypothetical protein